MLFHSFFKFVVPLLSIKFAPSLFFLHTDIKTTKGSHSQARFNVTGEWPSFCVLAPPWTWERWFNILFLIIVVNPHRALFIDFLQTPKNVIHGSDIAGIISFCRIGTFQVKHEHFVIVQLRTVRVVSQSWMGQFNINVVIDEAYTKSDTQRCKPVARSVSQK